MEIGVYGLGRFGAFWAALLAEHVTVKGFNRSPNRPVPPRVTRVDEEEIVQCDVLFLCTSISSVEPVLQRIGNRLKPGALVMDTCSVKMYPLRLMGKYLPDSVEYLGTHPMFGPDSGKNGISGLHLVMTYGRASAETKEKWVSFFSGLGCRVIQVSAEDHDREAAYTQGITHFIGRVLDDLKLKKSQIGTLGFDKLLEIIEQTCNDPWQLFIDLQRFNPYTSAMRGELSDSLEKIMDRLEGSLDMGEWDEYDVFKSGVSHGGNND